MKKKSFFDFRSFSIFVGLFLLFTFFHFDTVNAIQAGSLDESFRNGRVNGANDVVGVIVPQNDGKILIGGRFTTYNSISRKYIARLNTDGSLDTTFNVGTGMSDYVRAIAVQDDGKILVVGDFTSYNGSALGRIARLNSDGSLDTTFNVGTGFNNIVTSVAIANDGKILVGGYFTSYRGAACGRLARLNSDGSMDTIFNTNIGSGANGVVSYITEYLDFLIISGSFTSFNGDSSRSYIIRLHNDGVLDSSFHSGANGSITNSFIQQDENYQDKIIISGGFYEYDGLTRWTLARLNLDGTLDTSFASVLDDDWGGINTAILGSDNKIIIGGEFTFQLSNYPNGRTDYIARLNVDGSPDYSFYTPTDVNRVVHSLALQQNGQVLVGGSFTLAVASVDQKKDCIQRVNADGSKDVDFNTAIGFDYYVGDMAVQSDGKIVVGGFFETFDDVSKRRLARLNADGTLDETFDVADGGYLYQISSIAISPSNQIAIAGNISHYDHQYIGGFTVLDSLGSIAEDFRGNVGFNSLVRGMVYQSDGSLLLWGDFTSYNGLPVSKIARLNDRGELDVAFSNAVGSGWISGITQAILQDDGKIIIGGTLTKTDGITVKNIARLNSDGTLDTSFVANANAAVSAIGVQSDGSVIVGGSFTQYNGVSSSRLIKVDSTGVLQNNFSISNSMSLEKIKAQEDNKILVGGVLTSYYPTTKYAYLDRYNADSTHDNTFQFGRFSNDSALNSIKILEDGNILVGGNFVTLNGNAAVYLTQLESVTVVVAPTLTTGSVTNITINSATGFGSVTNNGAENPTRSIEWGTTSGVYTGSCSAGIGGVGAFSCNMTGLTNGTTYYVRAKAENSAGISYGEEMTFQTTAVVFSTITTGVVSSITTTTAQGNANVTSTGNENPARTIEWGVENGVYTSSCSAGIGGAGAFSCNMTGLTNGTTYYVRAKAENSAGISYGEEVTFQTLALLPSTVVTNAVTNIATATATLNANVTSTGNENPTRTIEWGTESGVYTNFCSAGISGAGVFSCNATGLASNNTYYIRAKVTNSAGTSYGSEVSFTTLAVTSPAVTTGAPSSIGVNAATANGNVISTGNENPTRTIEWGTVSGVYANSCSAGIGGVGAFSCNMTGLANGTTYYVRAKVTNSAGTSYGSEMSFTTPSAVTGLVETILSTNTYQGGGTAQGWRADDNAWTYLLPFSFNFYGVDYSTIKISSNGYICLDSAYACDSYTQQLTGTNNGPIIAPLAKDLNTSSQAGNNIFITQNGDDVVIRWNAVQYGQSTTLNFEAVLYSNGNIDFNYGAQAAAMTSSAVVGISKGDGLSYVTSVYNGFTNFNQLSTSHWGVPIIASSPTVTTQGPSIIGVTSVTVNGDIIGTGNEDPMRMFEYGIESGNYTHSCSAGTGGMGQYSCVLTNLMPNTMYYYKAKATNSAGISNGSELNFTTLGNIVIPDPDPTKIITRTNQGYMSIHEGEIDTAQETGMNVQVTFRANNADAILSPNTHMMRTGGGQFDFTRFVMQDVTTTVQQTLQDARTAVEVGIPDIGLTFSQPITMVLTMDPAYEGQTLQVKYQNDGEAMWNDLTTCAITNNQCIFQVDHFTTYSVVGGNIQGATQSNLNLTISKNLTLDCGADVDIDNGTSLIAGTPQTNTTTCNVTTNDQSGYTLSLTNDRGMNNTLYHESRSATQDGQIQDKNPWNNIIPNATMWSDTGFGFGVLSSTATKNETWWGTATDCNDTTQLYAGVPQSDTMIMQHDTYSNMQTGTLICYKINVPSTQISGEYTGSVTYTAIGRP